MFLGDGPRPRKVVLEGPAVGLTVFARKGEVVEVVIDVGILALPERECVENLAVSARLRTCAGVVERCVVADVQRKLHIREGDGVHIVGLGASAHTVEEIEVVAGVA